MPLRNTSAYRCAGSVIGGSRHITYQQVTNIGKSTSKLVALPTSGTRAPTLEDISTNL
ncbi:protein of unknown function [Petrocella atlantisensis]|uniref:Uncharacterized protein n=1 Tax=Petrocella atlantisensis TaxID=2173034 RepID=A0A3P7NZD7_9FIRM|nr:protein of unknown function [Petrocella atlantisensis]